MLFSSKISNSILTFLETQKISVEELYSSLDIPEEFIRDPSSWIDAKQMESFLKIASNHYFVEKGIDQLPEIVGRECANLHSWGVLDSVLRMIDNPMDIFAHPERFLSYFISPTPAFSLIESFEEKVSFEIPISNFDYPLSAKYLQTALESVPLFFGKEQAQVQWKDRYIEINWETKQDMLFEPSEMERNIKPDLLEALTKTLEKKQKELEIKNLELLEKNSLLKEVQKKLEIQLKEQVHFEKLSSFSELAKSIAHEINSPLSYITSNVSRLNDYFVRAQQLLTILVGPDRLSPPVQEAMRRMDWELVQKDFPDIVNEVYHGLKKVRDIVKDLSSIAGETVGEEKKISSDLNQIVGSAIRSVSGKASSEIKIDSHLLLNREVPAYPSKLEQALVNILSNAIQAIDRSGVVRVVTRPKGHRAEIEISDTGAGMDEEKAKSIFDSSYAVRVPGKSTGLGLSIARSIVEMHSGNIKVKSELGKGSTFSIELPM